ncbi:MAG: SHOCT domain-containing protein [Aquificae bacterium]|nr:SHOCT domain-containing protein [Aquificota bacterium]
MKPTDYPNLYSFMKEAYPEETQWLEDTYPNMMQTAKQIKIIPWQDEYAIADRNPEFIDQLKLLQMALDSGLISQEEYQNEVRKIPPASKTLAVALRQEKAVSFREYPSISVIIHELGHIHFDVDDLEWNSAYGGGENLIHITYSGKGHFTEEQIADYMRLYRHIYLLPLEEINQMAWKIGQAINEGLKEMGYTDFPVHPVSLMMTAGIIPSVEVNEGETVLWNTDPKTLDQKIKNGEITFEPKSLKSALLIFISAYIQDGFIHGDPFLLNYGKAFFRKLNKIKGE